MIRIYLPLAMLGLTGVGLIATHIPVVEHLGIVEVVLAIVGLKAHYTQE